jgi:hypothetical protein
MVPALSLTVLFDLTQRLEIASLTKANRLNAKGFRHAGASQKLLSPMPAANSSSA